MIKLFVDSTSSITQAEKEKYGVEIDFRPFIKVEPLTSKEFRQQTITSLDHTAVIFTARTAIDHFFNLCEELRVTIPETMKYFCMTEAIAVYLQKYIVYRKRKIFFGNPVVAVHHVQDVIHPTRAGVHRTHHTVGEFISCLVNPRRIHEYDLIIVFRQYPQNAVTGGLGFRRNNAHFFPNHHVD